MHQMHFFVVDNSWDNGSERLHEPLKKKREEKCLSMTQPKQITLPIKQRCHNPGQPRKKNVPREKTEFTMRWKLNVDRKVAGQKHKNWTTSGTIYG